MRSGFHQDKEDFQEDTFKIISSLVADCVQAHREKNVIRLFDDVDCLFVVASRRIVKKHPGFSDRLEDVRRVVYGSGFDDLSPQDLSVLFLRVRGLWMELAGVLDQEGLMFRARSNPGEMVLRGG